MLKQYFHRGYQARNSVHQATCRAKQAIAKQYWGTDIYLVPKILGHSYLEQNNTRAQLFRAKNTRVQLFSAKNTGAQLFRTKQYWDTAI